MNPAIEVEPFLVAEIAADASAASCNRSARRVYNTRRYQPMWTSTKRRVLVASRTTREPRDQ